VTHTSSLGLLLVHAKSLGEILTVTRRVIVSYQRFASKVAVGQRQRNVRVSDLRPEETEVRTLPHALRTYLSCTFRAGAETLDGRNRLVEERLEKGRLKGRTYPAVLAI
jgi:hypothetical protein